MYVIAHVKEDVCLSVPKSLYTENGLWSKVVLILRSMCLKLK